MASGMHGMFSSWGTWKYLKTNPMVKDLLPVTLDIHENRFGTSQQAALFSYGRQEVLEVRVRVRARLTTTWDAEDLARLQVNASSVWTTATYSTLRVVLIRPT